jgi:hypothetical protein
MAPPSGLTLTHGHRPVKAPIPLQYTQDQQRRQATKKSKSNETPTLAKREKSDTTSGDDGHARHSLVEQPMTPESLPSSLHKADGSVSTSHEEESDAAVQGQGESTHSMPNQDGIERVEQRNQDDTDAAGYAMSMPLLKSDLTLQATVVPDTTNGNARINGHVHNSYGDNNGHQVTKPHANSFKPLRIPQELPPEFRPSEASPTPLSSESSAMHIPAFQPFAPYSQHNDFHGYAPQMPPRPSHPMAFNPEANFHPVARQDVEMSRTPSHTSSVDRPMNGPFDLQSPMLPRTPATFNDPKLKAALALQDYIIGQFDNDELADTFLDISALTDRSESRLIRAHVLILNKSASLRYMINALTEPYRTVHVPLANRYMTEFGFVAAVKHLYGASLLRPDDFVHEMRQANFIAISSHAPATHAMSKILSYIAAGYFLDLPDIIGAGFDCVQYLQRWDTVPTCLVFALDGGLTQWWHTITDREDTADGPVTVQQQQQAPTFGEVGSHLLHLTLTWMAVNVPSNFQFSTTVAQLGELPRLPNIVENRPSTSNPRLSLLQFGQLPAEDDGRHFLSAFISSIFLSLPFAAFKYVFESPRFNPNADRFELVRAIVAEREVRRQKVLQAKRVKDGTRELWDATKWSEHVSEAAHVFPGFTLYRTHVDASAVA